MELYQHQMLIPVYIICWNNGWLARNTVEALKRFPQLRCVVVDNNSGPRTQAVLDELFQSGTEVIRFQKNYGHTVVADVLRPNAQYYIVTDPDLGLQTLPLDTIDRLLALSKEFNAARVGLALDISKTEDLLEGPYHGGKTIPGWEGVFWTRPTPNSLGLELYEADIDTTFALLNSNAIEGRFRLAGPYTVQHFMWHKSWVRELPQDDFEEYFTHPGNLASTTAHMVRDYRALVSGGAISAVRLPVTKQAVTFDVVHNVQTQGFWTKSYPSWEPETFRVFDRFADSTKVMVDIGAWVGPTVLYNAHKYQHVFAVEADRVTLPELEANIELNKLTEKVTLVKKAIYSELTTIQFGNNQHLNGSAANDSTSQIQVGTGGGYAVETITFPKLVEGIDPSTIGLIKVDIEGGEENIIEDLLQYHLDHRVPLYLSFHYSWWRTPAKLLRLKELFRHTNITETAVDLVQRYPFCSLLFR